MMQYKRCYESLSHFLRGTHVAGSIYAQLRGVPIAYWIPEAGGLMVSGADLGRPRGPMPPSKVFCLAMNTLLSV